MGNPRLLLIHRYADERLTVYVVLRVTSSSLEALNDILPRLEIGLDVHVIDHAQTLANYRQAGDHEGLEQDLIFSHQVKDDRDPLIAVQSSEGTPDEDGPTIFAIWDIEANLPRPRPRFSNLAVTFTPSATLTIANHVDQIASDDEHRPSQMPASINILEGLKAIPALEHRVPFLPASRIQSVLPGPQLGSETLRIRHKPAKRIPISPAVSARIRCSRMATNTPHPTSVASLDFEITPFATFDVVLNHANVSLASDGQIELLGPRMLPISCRPRSVVTFLYKVQPKANQLESPLPLASPRSDTIGVLDIVLESTLQISKDCNPAITMRWRSNVDFSMPPNTRPGPSSQPLQRSSRPSSLLFPSTTSLPTPTNPRPMTPPRSGRHNPLMTSANTTSSPSSTNLTISFTVPSTVPLGHIFNYVLILTNHSPRPLKLAIIPIPRRPPGSTLPPRKHAPRHSASSTVGPRHSSSPSTNPSGGATPTQNPKADIAPAVMDENIVHALQKASINSHSDTDLVPISADVRVGPLAPGACHEVQVRMLALRVGVLRLEAMRVVDLAKEPQDGGGGPGSGYVDVRADLLPEVVVVDAGWGGGEGEGEGEAGAEPGGGGE